MFKSRFRATLVALAVIGASLSLAGPASAADTDVMINEFSSNNPDFIELTNTGSAAVDLTGWVLKDSTENNSYTFPSGSSIAAGEFLGLSGEGVQFVFGLGNGDSVRLYAPGSVLVDSVDYPAHPAAGTSYGRCPDGAGAFVVTNAATKGAANDCGAPPAPEVTINEVESNGDTVADWVELKNVGTSPADVSGWKILDNDASHVATPVVVPANTVIPAGGYYAIYTEIAQTPGFGLGVGDSVTLLLPDGTTQVDTTTWGAHPATTWGRCPDGTGSFRETTTSTRGTANACSPIRINEVESSGGDPGDWIELTNISAAPVDISGWSLKDSGESPYVIPDGTVVQAGGYQVFDEAQFVFGLGGSDSVRLFDTTDTLVESYTWAAHALQSYGRCKDGVGEFTDTKSPTKGATNSCPGLDTVPWPGSQTVQTADLTETFLQDLSGLVFDPADPDVLWASQNKLGTLFKLVRSGDTWVPADGWPRNPLYPDGTGAPDTEGITIGPDGFVYLASERDNAASGISRMSILRYDPAATGATVNATNEWNLTSQIPAAGANLGLEGVTWVPDSFLTGAGFVDQSTGAAYQPADYPEHGTGLYFVAVEDTGDLIGFALDSDGTTSHKIATIDSGFAHLADVDFDPELGRLRAVTDDTHDGRQSLLKVDESGAFVVDAAYERPAGMPNLNNEGFAVAPQSQCEGGTKEVLWSDDGDTDGHSLRRGLINCTVPAAQDVAFTSSAPDAPVVGQTYLANTTGGGSANPVVLSIASASAEVCSLSESTVRFTHPGTCTLDADQAAAPGFAAGSATQTIEVAKASTSTLVEVADTALSAAVSVTDPGVASLSGSVEFSVDGAVVGSADLVNGVATLEYAVPSGSHAVTAVYSGNDDLLGSTGSLTVDIAGAPAPVVTGTVTVGSTLRVTTSVAPPPGASVTRRWLRNGAPIAGATGTTYKLTVLDAGREITARITFTRVGLPALSGVSSAQLVPAYNAKRPSFSGTLRVPATLSGAKGTWYGAGYSYGYQWLRNGSPIAGATGSTYRLVGADRATRISLRVTATREGYPTVVATSVAKLIR